MSGPTLLLGASGQLGTALSKALDNPIVPPRSELDLATATHDQVRDLIQSTRPRLLINAAAYTAVDRAEEETELATRVNGTSVGILAEVTAQLDIPFVTYSTDYVFNGRGQRPYVERDPTDPVNAYGQSKLVGENLAMEANHGTLIIRTSWVISGTHPNFVATMLRLTAEGQTLTVVNDQRGCPTVTTDLARATLDAVAQRATGLLHLTNQEATTWFYLARAAIGLAGIDPELIQPCTTAEYPTRAARPANSVLASERVGHLGVRPLPAWQESLPAVVQRLMDG